MADCLASVSKLRYRYLRTVTLSFPVVRWPHTALRLLQSQDPLLHYLSKQRSKSIDHVRGLGHNFRTITSVFVWDKFDILIKISA